MHALAVVLVIVHGLVVRGPTKPVCSMDVPCDEPAANVQLVFQRGTHTIRVRTDGAGHYTVKLPRGTYTLRVPPIQHIQPAQLVVRRAMRADLYIDTGIR
jgi:hypothetical protein